MNEAIHPQARRYTVEEYFAFDSASQRRHMYLDGEIIAMAGGTGVHAIIMSNLAYVLHGALHGTPCRHVDSNLRIRYGRKAKFGYSDGLVVCGPFQYDAIDHVDQTLLNPKVVIEVLSPSTERFDRVEKFDLYREVESLRDYVLISQDRPRVEVISRQEDGGWRVNVHQGVEAMARLPPLGIELAIKDIFADITFPPTPLGLSEGVVIAHGP